MSQIIHNIGDTPNDGTGDSLRQAFDAVNQNVTELYNNKEDKANKTNSVASNLTSTLLYPSVKGIVDYINTNVNGVPYLGSVTPSSTPTGTGAATWSATEAGTYTNFGGVVVSANSFATIGRNAAGTFSISQTALNLSSYAKNIDYTLSDSIIRGVNLFTFAGKYINSSTGVESTDSNFKCTDYLPLTIGNTLSVTGLSIGGLFRQASFFSDRTTASFISSYTADNNTAITLNATNIPASTKYIRLNTATANSPVVTYDGVDSQSKTSLTVSNILVDKENKIKFATNINLFTITGKYINLTTGDEALNASYKCTDYIDFDPSIKVSISNLAIGGAFRQASFFSAKSPSSLISSYTADNNINITLNSDSIPINTRYIRLNTAIGNSPVITVGNAYLKPIAPTGIDIAAWKTISSTSGYSATYGRYWDATQFVNVNDFNGLIYPVTAGTKIHVRGNFYGGNLPIVVFFSDFGLATFVANGVQRGTISLGYYDFIETVPSGATFAFVQQYHGVVGGIAAVAPFPEIVVNSDIIVSPKKVILIGDSLTQMDGYATELMASIKAKKPEYDVYNYGIGGEKSLEIGARIGSLSTIISPPDANTTIDAGTGRRYFTVPADASTVNIGANSILNGWDNTALALLRQTTILTGCSPSTISIEGVPCRLTYSAPNYFIQRITAGAAVKVFKGSKMYFTNAPVITPDDIVILNMTANGGYADTTDLVAQYRRMTELINTDKIIFLSSHYADITTPGSQSYITIMLEREAALQKAFGNKYINTREYFCTYALADALSSGYWNTGTYPTDIGGEAHPTTADTTAMTAGAFAPMFWCNPNNSADILHLSRRSYAIRDNYIFKRIQDLKYLE